MKTKQTPRRGVRSKEIAFRILQNAATAHAAVVVLIPTSDGMNDPVYIDGSIPYPVALAWIDAALRGGLRMVAVHYEPESDMYRAWSISGDGSFEPVTREDAQGSLTEPESVYGNAREIRGSNGDKRL